MRRALLLGKDTEVDTFLEEITEGLPATRLLNEHGQASHNSAAQAGDDETKKTIEKKKQDLGTDNFYVAARKTSLQVIDMHWMEHLEAMDYLRSSVNLRAYGQRDPLVEYKKEGLRLFQDMKENIYGQVFALIANLNQEVVTISSVPQRIVPRNLNLSGGGTEEGNRESSSARANPGVSMGGKIGRNDPCPCGAKKPDGTSIKYKHCHGK